MADRSGIVNKINNYQNKANKVYQFSFLDEIKKGKEALRQTKDEDHFQKEFDSISIGSEQELNGVIVSTAEKSRAGSFATAYDSEENPLLEVTQLTLNSVERFLNLMILGIKFQAVAQIPSKLMKKRLTLLLKLLAIL